MSPTTKPHHAFIELPSVESTNNYAMRLIHDRVAQSGTCVFAHHQTAGKGQRQKQWHSAAGQNIALSIIVQPQGLAPSQQPLLSAAVAVAVRRFFAQHAGDAVTIKWPNDIYWCDRKAGGILIEAVLQGHQWLWAVIGVGLNINQTDFGELQERAVSLRQITGKEFVPVALAKALGEDVLNCVAHLPESEKEIQAEYNLHLYKRHQQVQLKKGSRSFSAVINSVAPNGELIVDAPLEERYGVGEVVWVGRVESRE